MVAPGDRRRRRRGGHVQHPLRRPVAVAQPDRGLHRRGAHQPGRGRAQPVPLVDTGIPQTLLWAFRYPENTYSHVLRPFADETTLPAVARWTGCTCSTTAAASPPWSSRPTRTMVPNDGCGYPLEGKQTKIPLDGPVIGGGWWIQIGYASPRPVSLRVEAGDDVHDLDLPKGLHNAFVQASGEFQEVTVSRYPRGSRSLRGRPDARRPRAGGHRVMTGTHVRTGRTTSAGTAPRTTGRVPPWRHVAPRPRDCRRRPAMIVAQLAFRAWATYGSWFHYDDFNFMSRMMNEGLGLAVAGRQYAGHVMPAGMYLTGSPTTSPRSTSVSRRRCCWRCSSLADVGAARAPAPALRVADAASCRRWRSTSSRVISSRSPSGGRPASTSSPCRSSCSGRSPAHVSYLRTGGRGTPLARAPGWCSVWPSTRRPCWSSARSRIVSLCYFAAGTLRQRACGRCGGATAPAIVMYVALGLGYLVVYVLIGLNFSPGRAGQRRPGRASSPTWSSTPGRPALVGGPLHWEAPRPVRAARARACPVVLASLVRGRPGGPRARTGAGVAACVPVAARRSSSPATSSWCWRAGPRSSEP